MTVSELFDKCESTLKVMSAYNGKVLCHRFIPEKHKEIGERRVSAVWADIVVKDTGFEHYARPIMCVYADGLKEMEKENHDERTEKNSH